MAKCSDKYELYMDNPSVYVLNRDNFFCGNITKRQVDNFLKELSKYESVPESGCFNQISAHVLTKSSKHILVVAPNNNQNFEEFYNVLKIDFEGVKCKCDHCLDNIKSGRCKDDFVRKIIGKTLFGRMYANQK